VPLFDCLTCDCYVPGNRNRPEGGGVCHGRPPRSQFIGYQQQPQPPGGLVLGGQQIPPQPLFVSTYAQVSKGDWCAVHPMFQAMRAVRPALRMAAPEGDGKVAVPIPPAVDEPDDGPPLPGEVKPGSEKETAS
jgi:hypothetical protein